MPTAHELATELRKLADSFDVQPEAAIRQVSFSFYCDTKDEFLATARFIPRPFKKSEDSYGHERYRRIRLINETPSVRFNVSVEKVLTCELVEPAKPAVYRCVPILSLEEDAVLTEAL